MPVKKTSKETLIVQAMKVFRRQGYHNTSIRDLSKACGIQKAHFYYYFPEGKTQLMAEILEAVKTFFSDRIAAVAYDESIAPEERLSQMATKLGRIFLGEQGGCIMGNTALETIHLAPEPAFMEVVRNYFAELIEALKFVYETQFDPETSQEFAERAIQDIEGGIMLMQLYKDKKYLLNALQRMVQVI
ncbi:TetR/AcrR family transcriptional regulator [Pontibacter sp. G13]|uniref:TetR/AcrR family transcriptional regulator n=1 Tax=Pontibacter sp. G13 TaxID=3074898 RepID=UPI002888FDA4|nr:TetR/AcrR family transcriptional regulator [Pontibacter sp. G13]WNJ19631.1 TetR/AcrR family transcriptional regulator [Pontibacter sp. G13]